MSISTMPRRARVQRILRRDGSYLATLCLDPRGRHSRSSPVTATVTRWGHWYRDGDPLSQRGEHVCRGCGAAGRSPRALDAAAVGRGCVRPPTDQDLVAALSVRPLAIPRNWLSACSPRPKVLAPAPAFGGVR